MHEPAGSSVPHAVYDCVVYLQGAVSAKGPAFALLRLAAAGEVRLHTSADILGEIRGVLTRPEIRRRFPRLTPQRVDAFLGEIGRHATQHIDVPQRIALPRDPKDVKYLNLALAAVPCYLVTRDKDLLDLAGDAGFRATYPGLTILDPVAFLRLIDA